MSESTTHAESNASAAKGHAGKSKAPKVARVTRASQKGPKVPEVSVVTPEVLAARQHRDEQDALNASPGFREAPANPSHESTLGALDGAPPEVAREYARTGKTPVSHIRKVTDAASSDPSGKKSALAGLPDDRGERGAGVDEDDDEDGE